MLEENEPQLKIFALKKLNYIVDEFWAEISEAIEKMSVFFRCLIVPFVLVSQVHALRFENFREVLHEDASFSQRELAALVASKVRKLRSVPVKFRKVVIRLICRCFLQVYYHLGSFEDSLTFALGAGNLFDVNHNTEYVETIISKCIDHYTKLRIENNNSDEQKVVDPRLESIVNRMFQRCFDDGQYKQAVGIALETRRMDIFQKAILESVSLVLAVEFFFLSFFSA